MRNEVRAPRLALSVGGIELPGAISADVFSNNYLASDRFRVRLADSRVLQDALHRPDARVDISASLEGEWINLLTGRIDTIRFDPVARVLEVEGRDLSSLLIEAQVNETFTNRTSSEIAETLAGRHRLRPIVERTSTPVGRYYQAEHDRLMLGQFAKAMTEWDLLAFLARQEGFDLFTDGDVLRFGPRMESIALRLKAEDCVSLKLERLLGLGRQVEVTVRSWGTKAGAAVVETARSGNAGSVWKHAICRPNLTAAEARKLAERILADLVRHEWSAAATMPGELSLTARSRVAVVGTGTAWDREYGVSQLTRHLDVRRGFVQRLCLQGV